MTDSAKTSSAQAQEPSSNDDSRIVTSAHHHHRHHHHYPQPQIIYVLANPQDLPLNAYSQSWPHPQQAPAAVMPQVTPLLPPPPPAAHAPIPNHIQQSSICTTVVDDCCADCCPVAASETNGEQPVSEVQTSAPACCSPTMESQRMTAVPYAIRPPNLHHFQSLRPIAPYTMASAAPPVNMNSVTSAISHFHGQHNVFTTHTPKLTTPQTQHGQPQRHSHSVSPPKSPTGASPERSKTPSTEDLQASQKTRNNIDRPSQAAVQDKVTNDQSNSDMETPDSNITVDGTNNNESALAESAESSLTALSEAAVAAAGKQRNDLPGHKRKLDEQQGEARCLWAACAAVFKCIDDVIPHLTKLHVGSRSIKASNQCRWEQCKTEKEDTDELISHVCQDHLGTLELKHGCHWRDCDTRFDSFDDLTDHLSERHIGTGKSQYVCSWEECERQGRAFNQRQKVMRHIQTHTGDKPYQCNVCNKRFSEANIMTQHMRRHTGEKPYRCPETGCAKEFSISGALTIHKRVHSGEKPFHCKFDGCDKRFAESSNLTKHTRVHTGERPFKCTLPGCDRRFSRPDQLSRHEKTHKAK